MSNDDPNEVVNPTENPETTPISDENLSDGNLSAEELEPSEEGTPAAGPAEVGNDDASQAARRRILIGSQKDPAAYRARRVRDWTPVATADSPNATTGDAGGQAAQPKPAGDKRSGNRPAEPNRPAGGKPQQRRPDSRQRRPEGSRPASAGSVAADKTSAGQNRLAEENACFESTLGEPTTTAGGPRAKIPSESLPTGPVPKPSVRDRLTPDLEDELDRAMGNVSLDTLMSAGISLGDQAVLEDESRHTGRVVAVRHDDVFVELGSREQGCIAMKQFEQPPEVGAALEVVVQRFNHEEGLYELSLPNRAVSVDDWGDLKEGMLVDAHVTGHNTGGLECEVNHLRGFIPVSQIALYRVEDLAPFVGEKFTCVITEANPERRNLVLSRRAVLEREKEEVRQQLLGSLRPGQIHEGVVRKLMPFGAFVDIGGIDGLLHISQLAWHRVEHPSEVLSEGQTIKVKIEKIDPATGKMSLAYREMLENPWENAPRKYPVHSTFEGTVTRLMEFGAFVEMERGIEGLVHISELSHKRVWRASDVVHQGDKVQVMVLSVDPKAQRMSLSIRQTTAAPEPVKKEGEEPSETSAEAAKKRQHRSDQTLKGGIGRAKGGEKFGLRW